MFQVTILASALHIISHASETAFLIALMHHLWCMEPHQKFSY